MILYAESEGPDQTVPMHSQVWIFAVYIGSEGTVLHGAAYNNIGLPTFYHFRLVYMQTQNKWVPWFTYVLAVISTIFAYIVIILVSICFKRKSVFELCKLTQDYTYLTSDKREYPHSIFFISLRKSMFWVLIKSASMGHC